MKVRCNFGNDVGGGAAGCGPLIEMGNGALADGPFPKSGGTGAAFAAAGASGVGDVTGFGDAVSGVSGVSPKSAVASPPKLTFRLPWSAMLLAKQREPLAPFAFL
jgi:hypothetical protein